MNPQPRADAPPEAMRVLIVEDSALVAMEVEYVVRGLGWVVVGPAATLKAALDLASREPVHGAILDLNLHGESGVPVADILSERGVPFIFATGYDVATVTPERYHATPVASKPFRTDALIKAMKRAFLGDEEG